MGIKYTFPSILHSAFSYSLKLDKNIISFYNACLNMGFYQTIYGRVSKLIAEISIFVKINLL